MLWSEGGVSALWGEIISGYVIAKFLLPCLLMQSLSFDSHKLENKNAVSESISTHCDITLDKDFSHITCL